jgi:hypothetical protein
VGMAFVADFASIASDLSCGLNAFFKQAPVTLPIWKRPSDELYVGAC